MMCLERTTRAILQRAGCDETGQPVKPMPFGTQTAEVIPAEQVQEALDACALTADERGEVARNPVLYEQPATSVNMSIDDVVVKQHKLHRTRRDAGEATVGETEGRKYVHTTVAHIQRQEQTYCTTGQGVPTVLRIRLGYLRQNAFLGGRLQFFVDGQKPLHASMLRAFMWFTNLGMILDWYHLADTWARQLSLAMKGATLRHETLADISKLLWYGQVESAITFLRQLPTAKIKHPDAIQGRIGDIERNRPYLPCDEVRKRVGLRNSSHIGETMNGLLVSGRQKHQGMSWSVNGSQAIADLEALTRNDEYQHWCAYHEIPLQHAA